MEKISKIKQLPLKILLFIVVNDLLDTTAQLLMKKGVAHCIDIADPNMALFWIGLTIYLSNFFLWMYILSKIDLSVAMPLASFSYIFIPVAAVFFLHEHVHLTRWLGLVFILLGIFFVSQSRNARGDP